MPLIPIEEQVQALELPPLVELFTVTYVDAAGITTVQHLTNTYRVAPIFWDAAQYISLPLSITGIGYTEDNLSEKPRIALADINGAYATLFPAIPNLKGATLDYTRTFATYIGATSETSTNVAILRRHYKFGQLVSKTSGSNRQIVYSLDTYLTFNNKQFPSRQMLREGKFNLSFPGMARYR